MDSVVEIGQQIYNQLTLENLFVLIGLIILFSPIYIYSLRTEKKRLHEIVESKVEVLKKIFDVSEDAVLILSNQNEVLYANKMMIKLFKIKDDFLHSTLKEMPMIKDKESWISLEKLIKDREKAPQEKMHSFLQAKLLIDKREIPVNIHIDSSVVNREYKIWWNIISIHDLRKEEERTYAAYRHKLTNIPNQLQALQDLNALYSKIHLEDKKIALILLEIDNFSSLRSIIGYEQANDIIKKFAQYLEGLAKEANISVYHTFHNNFLMTMSSVDSIDDVLALVKKVQGELASFYKMEDVRMLMTASAGIGIYPDSGSTLNLLDNTYKALAQAEENGHGRVQVYVQDKSTHKYNDLILFNELHEAIKRDEFEVYYQPIINAKNQQVVSAEALMRWNHPKYGFISPDIFIPILEKTGLIIDLGEYVLKSVLKQQKRWELFKFRQIVVSINLAMLEIEKVDFVEKVEKLLQDYQVEPELIRFEITEGVAMVNEEIASRQFKALRKLGIGLSLDDFGTGYTSFSYLRKFPADTLKIDKTLVDNLLTHREDKEIVKSIIDLGHNLGMKVVVEGVENKKMAEIISSYGCDYIQGYYFSKALPAFEFQELLR